MAATLRIILGINDFVSTYFGVCCNSLLIYMIIKTKNKELEKYNAILLQCTLVDIFLNIATFIARPIVVTYNGRESVIVNSLIPISQQAEQFLSAFWVMALFCSICALPTSFFYRYRVLCLNKPFPLCLQLTCLAVTGVIAITYAGHYYYAFCIRTKDRFYLAEELAPWFAADDGKVKAISIIGNFDKYVYLFMSHAMVLTVGNYVIIIYFSWKVYKFMKCHKSAMASNPNFIDVQNQLTKTLIAQSIIPLFTFALPIICIIVTVTTPIHIPPVVSATTSSFLSYIPMGNALSMLFFVKSYRMRCYMLIVVTYNGRESIIVNSLIPISQQAEQFLSAFWIFALVYSICALPTSFFYRYRVLCLNKPFPLSLQLKCLLISGIIAATYAGHYYYAFCIRTKDKLHLAEELAPWFATEDGKVKVISIMGNFDKYVYFFMTHAVLVTIGAYIIIIYLSWKVYRFLKYHKAILTLSSNFIEIQNQLTKTLIAQSIIPLFTFAIPVVCIITTVTLPIHISPAISATTSSFLSYIPMGNALSILFFVKSYRMRCYLTVKKYFDKLVYNYPTSVFSTS